MQPAGSLNEGKVYGSDDGFVRSRHHGIHIFNVCTRAPINIQQQQKCTNKNLHVTWSELVEAMTFIKGGPEDPPAFPFVSELIVCRPHARDETNLS